MSDLFRWIAEHEQNKFILMLILFGTYIGIAVYLFTNKRRAERLESYRHIPLDDDVEESESDSASRREDRNHE